MHARDTGQYLSLLPMMSRARPAPATVRLRLPVLEKQKDRFCLPVSSGARDLEISGLLCGLSM